MRTRMMILSLMVLSLGALSFTTADRSATASEAPWRRLGSKSVDYLIDHDAIDVGRSSGAFKQLKIVVTNGSLNMHRCVVHFQNGEDQTLDVRQNFKNGTTSRVVDLAGNKRIIDRITFWYDTKHKSNRKAVVTVWGK